MFYKYLQLPAVLKINSNVANLDAILDDHNLYFRKKILITTEHLYQLYKLRFKGIKNLTFKRLQNFDLKNIHKLNSIKNQNGVLIIGFGGGKVIDYAKYFASLHNMPFFSIPSTLSNDGLYSPVAILKDHGKRFTIGISPPVGVLVDIAIIKQSPRIHILSGVGDLISNISALDDWKLAHQKIGEPINDFAFTLSHMAAYSILYTTTTDIYEDKFLKKLAYGLVVSGLAMSIAGNSRPASGAEHQISHAIDALFPEKSTHHGIQVAFGCLLIEKRLRKKRYVLYKKFFDKIGLTKAIRTEITFSPKEEKAIIQAAAKIRDRFTVLSLLEDARI